MSTRKRTMTGEESSHYHRPVLLNEVIEALEIKKDSWYVDGTVGGGGHTKAILDQGGCVLAIDQDVEAISHVEGELALYKKDKRLITALANFTQIAHEVKKNQLTEVDGILVDLGMSTAHIKQSGKGFSFLRNEPLDMRMSGQGRTAGEVVNTYSFEQLKNTISKYGEDILAGQIAAKILEARRKQRIETSGQLAKLVEEVYQRNGRREKIHPATRTFQALRIEVNNEIENLREVLDEGFNILSSGGRLVFISFHSLEDRIVKLFFLKQEQSRKAKIVTKKPIMASETEVQENSASRSAKLRVLEKL